MTDTLANWPLTVRAGFGKQVHAGAWRLVESGEMPVLPLVLTTRCGLRTALFITTAAAQYGPTCRRCLDPHRRRTRPTTTAVQPDGGGSPTEGNHP